MNSIVILDNSAYIRHRIREILKKYSIELHEASNSNEFFSIIGRYKNEIGLVITEVNIDKEDGLDIIAHSRKRGHDIPFIVLTGQNQKGAFIRSIENGASDYILKPFDDDFLLERIMNNMNFAHESDEAIDNKRVSMDFSKYISGELKKAQKGDYELSVFMCVISKNGEGQQSQIGHECEDVCKLLYPKLKELFWDTDILISFGNHSYLGVLPFCTYENTRVVEDKIEGIYEELKQINAYLESYRIDTVFVTYPNEIKTKDELFPKLNEKLNVIEINMENVNEQDDSV